MATGLNLNGKDPKTAVNQFCQRYCKRPVTKDDIVYETTKFPQGFQATVRLNCIDGQEFAGEVHPNQKDAEKSASQQVLSFYAKEISEMPPPTASKSGSKKRKASGSAGAGTEGSVVSALLSGLLPGSEEPAEKAARVGEEELPPLAPQAINAAATFKSELNTTCSKILRRVMEKGEVHYDTNQVVGGFQATVQMPNLPDEWGQQVWAGQVCSKKADAEQSAAAIALEALQGDPSLMAAYNAPPKQKNWPSGGKAGNSYGGAGYGYSKGKGKGWGSGGKLWGPSIPPAAAHAWAGGGTGGAGAAGGWGGGPFRSFGDYGYG